jgi:3-oxoacyl-[acyl-carrier protein] reductase
MIGLRRLKMRLKDKVAIITGGAEGIGKAYCLGYAREGAKVVVADINLAAANVLVDEINRQGGEAMATDTDVSRIDQVDKMARKTLDRFGRVDILLNNAGMYKRNVAVKAATWEMDPADWDRVIAVNLTGVFLCCRAVLPDMVKRKEGKIINVASSLAFFGTDHFTHYVASKGGVVGFTRALAREVGAYNINVNSLCPGYTLSGDPSSITEDTKQIEVAARCFKRAEYPEDLVGTAVYLASAESDFVTGQAIVVDGGHVMH